MIQDVIDVQARRIDGFDARNIAGRALHILGLFRRNDQCLVVNFKSLKKFYDLLRLRSLEIESIQNEKAVFLDFIRKRTLDGKTTLLARHAESIGTRMRSEDRAAADPQRGTTRTAACATSAFLLPRLAPAAADERTGFRGMGAEPLRRELHDDRLMQESAVDFHAENIII